MLSALLIMIGLAAAAGVATALAARRTNDDRDRLIGEIDALLPQTQCGRCTYTGCRPYATALADGEADINQCPPGGDATAAALAKLLGRESRPVDPRFSKSNGHAPLFFPQAQLFPLSLGVFVGLFVGSSVFFHSSTPWTSRQSPAH